MANHKRRRPKSSRSGCLMCKHWKHQANKDSIKHQTRQEQRSRVSEKEMREDVDKIIE